MQHYACRDLNPQPPGSLSMCLNRLPVLKYPPVVLTHAWLTKGRKN